MAALDDAIATEELLRRPARSPDYEAEARAFAGLAHDFVREPRSVPRRVAEAAIGLCLADGAGVSLLEDQDGTDVLRPLAVAGAHAEHASVPTPRDSSPCGIALGRAAPQLFLNPARHFGGSEPSGPPVAEQLVVPLFIDGRAAGTLWVKAYDPGRRFDAEDVRVLTALADVCSAALQAPPPHAAAAPDPGAHSEGERRFQVLVQNITDYAIMMLDKGGRIITWSEGAARIKHYTEAEVLGRHVSIFYPPEELHVGRPEQEMAVARSEGRSEVEGFRVRKGGSKFWANEIITAIRDDAGDLSGYAKISRDLTEQKAIQDALRESEERNRLLVDNARDYAIFMCDADARIASWNTGAERIFGYTGEEAVGRDVSILYTPEDRAAAEDRNEFATALSEGRASDDRWQMRKGGERFFASGVTTPLRDGSGALRGFAKIARDLTETRRVDEQRERMLEREKVARLEAEQAATVRDEFLAVVSHELRTPLTAILLWAKMLETGIVSPEEQPPVFSTIRQSAEAQRQLIEDLLDMSGILAGKLRINVREVELAPAVQAAVDAVTPMAEARGVTLDTSIAEGTGKVRADPDRVQQVVWNLLNNAVKFTDAGGRVRLRLARVDGVARVEVSDTGRGIPPEFLQHVFERFRQADASTTRAHGGLGLGLAICRQLVELHGGTIRAESAGPGHGSTFTAELPLIDGRGATTAGPRAAGALPSSGFVPSPVLKGLRVLLVEDDPSTRAVMRWVLERCEAEVTAVASASQAVAAFRESLSKTHFDVIASDIGLPVQDGYELIRELREMEARRSESKPVPALALTAYARAEDRNKALAAGFRAHLSKPIEPRILVEAVAKVAGRDGEFEPAVPPAGAVPTNVGGL